MRKGRTERDGENYCMRAMVLLRILSQKTGGPSENEGSLEGWEDSVIKIKVTDALGST